MASIHVQVLGSFKSSFSAMASHFRMVPWCWQVLKNFFSPHHVFNLSTFLGHHSTSTSFNYVWALRVARFHVVDISPVDRKAWVSKPQSGWRLCQRVPQAPTAAFREVAVIPDDPEDFVIKDVTEIVKFHA